MAYLGDAAARELVCPPGTGSAWTSGSFGAALRGLARWGQDALVCAAIAAAREVIDADLTGWRRREQPGALRTIEAAGAWLACPCEEHVWGIVTRCQQTTSPDDWLWWLGEVFACLRAQTSPTDATVECVSRIARVLGDEARVRAAICAALIPVALGEGR